MAIPFDALYWQCYNMESPNQLVPVIVLCPPHQIQELGSLTFNSLVVPHGVLVPSVPQITDWLTPMVYHVVSLHGFYSLVE